MPRGRRDGRRCVATTGGMNVARREGRGLGAVGEGARAWVARGRAEGWGMVAEGRAVEEREA